jgi:hypothetical protein
MMEVETHTNLHQPASNCGRLRSDDGIDACAAHFREPDDRSALRSDNGIDRRPEASSRGVYSGHWFLGEWLRRPQHRHTLSGICQGKVSIGWEESWSLSDPESNSKRVF